MYGKNIFLKADTYRDISIRIYVDKRHDVIYEYEEELNPDCEYDIQILINRKRKE